LHFFSCHTHGSVHSDYSERRISKPLRTCLCVANNNHGLLKLQVFPKKEAI
jgi:hypothetical protein